VCCVMLCRAVQADAVSHLLTDLMGAKEDIEAAQSAVIAATAAALSAAGHTSAAAGQVLLGSTAVGSYWGSAAAGAGGAGGAGSTASPRTASQTAPGGLPQCNGVCSTDADAESARASASAPGAATGSAGLRQQHQQQRVPFTAVHALLPDRVVAKLQAACASHTGGQQHSRGCTPHLQLPLQRRGGTTGHGGTPHSASSPRSRSEGGTRLGKPVASPRATHRCMTEQGAYQRNAGRSCATSGSAKSRSCSTSSSVAASCQGGCQETDPEQQQQQPGSRLQSPLLPRSITQGSEKLATQTSNQLRDTFFLSTGGACISQGLQGRGAGPASDSQQEQQQEQQQQHQTALLAWNDRHTHSAAAAAAGSACGYSRQYSTLQETDPADSSLFLTAAPVGLPVLAPSAVAAVQQQLATGSISLPTTRRHRSTTQTPPTTSAAVVSLALSAEAAAAGSHRRESSTAAGFHGAAKVSPWQQTALSSPGRCSEVPATDFRYAEVPGHRTSLPGGVKAPRGSVYGGQGPAHGAAHGSRSSGGGGASARRSSAVQHARPFSVYASSPGGRLSSGAETMRHSTIKLTAGNAAGRSAAAAAAAAARGGGGRASMQDVGDTASSAQQKLQGATTERAATAAGGASAARGPAAAAAAGHSSPARPMPGGVFVELDGPTWDAAERAADAASWCLSARGSRQQHSAPQQQQQQQQASLQEPGEEVPQAADTASATAAVAPQQQYLCSPAGAAAVIAAAQDLLSQPLPPGSLGSGCVPAAAAAAAGSSPQCCSPGQGLPRLQANCAAAGTKALCEQGALTAAAAAASTADQAPTQDQQWPGAAAWLQGLTGLQQGSPLNAGSPAGTSGRVLSHGGRSGQLSTAGRSSRPCTVPKLQLATLQCPVQAVGCCLSSPATPSSSLRCSTVAIAEIGACRSPRSAVCVNVCSGPVSACAQRCQMEQQQEQQQGGYAGVLPPVLPAFTPRRIWAPGGSKSRSEPGWTGAP
jgi:hypothetical protein